MASSYRGNFAYVEDVLGVSPSREPELFDSCQEAMEKYSSPWWHELRHDHVELAAMQIKEAVLRTSMHTFKKGIEMVIARHLKTDELSFTNDALRAEFFEKYAALKAE